MNRLPFLLTCSSGCCAHACVCICCSSLGLTSFSGVCGGRGILVGMLLMGTAHQRMVASCFSFTQYKEALKS